MKNVGHSRRGCSQGVPKNFSTPMYRAHCAVIFAIAQLSCYICSLYFVSAFVRINVFVIVIIVTYERSRTFTMSSVVLFYSFCLFCRVSTVTDNCALLG